MIVVAILGILAAIALPAFQGHVSEAKQAAARENLHILRTAIELYAAKHNGVPPGYENNDMSNKPQYVFFFIQLIESGNYLSKLPVNPFNERNSVIIIDNTEQFPAEPFMPDAYAWIYKPAEKMVKLNWPGTDFEGVPYFDY